MAFFFTYTNKTGKKGTSYNLPRIGNKT